MSRLNITMKILFVLFLQLFFIVSANAAILSYTPSDDGISYSHGALSRINDGNIATNGTNDYQVHPSNAVGKTITILFQVHIVVIPPHIQMEI